MKLQDSSSLAVMLAATALSFSASEGAIAQPQPSDHPEPDADTSLNPRQLTSTVKSTATPDAPTQVARNFAETTDVEWSDEPVQSWENRLAEPYRDAPTMLLFGQGQVGEMVMGTDRLSGSDSRLWQVGNSRVRTGQAETPDGTVALTAQPEQGKLVLSHEDMVLKLHLEATPATAENLSSSQTSGLRASDLPRQLTGGSDVVSATGVAIASDGTVWLVGSKLRVNPDGQTVVGEAVTADNLDTVTIEHSRLP